MVEKPLNQIFKNVGQNLNTTANAFAHQPGIAAAGAALGIPKGIADVPAYLGGAGMEGWDYLRGNVQPHGESPLDKYEAGWRDLAINVGSLGQNTDVDRQEKERAAGAALTMTSMAAPGIPGLKALKGGAGGIAGAKAVQGITAASDFIAPVAGKITSPILDPLLKSAGKGIIAAEAKAIGGETKEYLKMMLNSKSTTNYVKAQDPHVIAALSNKYQVPIAKLDDLGETLNSKYKQVEIDNQATKDLYLKKKEIIKQQVTLADLPRSQKAELSKTLNESLSKPKGVPGLDKFIDNELKDIPMSDPSRHLLKEELKIHTLYNRKYNDLNEANVLYDSLLKKANAFEEGTKIATKDENLLTVLDEFDNTKLVESARRLRTNYDSNYQKSLLTGDNTLIEQAHQARLTNNKRLIDDLTKIDPKLAAQYDKVTTQSFIGSMGKMFNMFKAEPYIGDLTQVAEAFPIAKISNAEALGIDYATALKHEGEFGTWYTKNNKKMVNDIIFSKYKNQLKALHEVTPLNLKGGLPDKIQNIGDFIKSSTKKAGEIFDEIGFSFQSQARERLVESSLLPAAYGQVKAWGKFAEGSVEFNNAVMNRTMKFMQDTGMIPTKMKTVASIGGGKFKTMEHIDQVFKNAFDKAPVSPFIKENLKASTQFMTTWVKGAAQAKLQSYNGIVESLRDIGRTGQVTDYARHKIVTGMSGLLMTSAIFGARGIRVPGVFVEMTTDPNKSQVDNIPETVGTLMANWAADTVKFDNDTRNLLRDGIFQKVTGRAAARTETIPMFGAGLGNEIASSIVMSKGGKVIEAAKNAMSAGSIEEATQIFMETAYGMITPVDIDKMVDQQVEGKSYDSKGQVLDLPERGTVIDQLGAISKNMPSEYEKSDKVKYLSADDQLKKEYSRMDITEFLEGDNINELVTRVGEYYPNDQDKQESVIKGVIESIMTPEKTKLYSKLGSDSKEMLALPDSAIKENKVLQRLSKKESIKIAAQSGVFESDRQTLKLLVKAGKLDLTEEATFNGLIEEITRLETSPYAKLFKEEEE